MKIGLFVNEIRQFEPITGQNTQGRCATEDNTLSTISIKQKKKKGETIYTKQQ